MARKHLAYACLLATLVVAGAMPTTADLNEPVPALPDTSAVDEVAGYGPSCSKTEDDAGTGGTSVSCKYSCGARNFLAIGGHAADSQAKATGDTACGGTFAICQAFGPKCRGVSEFTSSQAESMAKCNGMSDEWWSSPMTIACAAQTTNPEDIICRLIRDLCSQDPSDPGEPGLPSATDDVERLLTLCDDVVAGAEGLAGFVLATVEESGFVALTYDPVGGCRVDSGLL